jgi:hypothetical protein
MNNASNNSEIINAARDWVCKEYDACVANNKLKYLNGDVMASKEYTYENQKIDALQIIHMFFGNTEEEEAPRRLRVISIIKRTKVGMDGLMIEILKGVCTHSDNDIVISPNKVLVLTGMSNKAWESNLIENMPSCFKTQVYHHGKLNSNHLNKILSEFQNGLIIIDEIDTGDGDRQKLFTILHKHKLTKTKMLYEKNIRFLVVSATMKQQQDQLNRWDEGIHESYKMTIPENYITHQDLLNKGIIQEFYSTKSLETAKKWIEEDILTRYGNVFRVHIIRTDKLGEKIIQEAARDKDIKFISHTSEKRILKNALIKIFDNVDQHIIIAIKGFWRRANLIPNEWKIKLGAVMEYYSNDTSVDVQIQGLSGRLTGYWQDEMLDPHHIPPLIRTSIKAIEKYEEWFNSPSSKINNYKGPAGKIPFLSPEIFEGTPKTPYEDKKGEGLGKYRIYDNEETTRKVCNLLGYKFVKPKEKNSDGFLMTSINRERMVVSLEEAIKAMKNGYGTNKGTTTLRTYFPCYIDKNNLSTLKFIVSIRPVTCKLKLAECDLLYSN